MHVDTWCFVCLGSRKDRPVLLYTSCTDTHYIYCLKGILKGYNQNQLLNCKNVSLKTSNYKFYEPRTRISLLNRTIDANLEIGTFIYISSQCWDEKLKNSVTMEAFTPQTTQGQFLTTFLLACHEPDAALIRSIRAIIAITPLSSFVYQSNTNLPPIRKYLQIHLKLLSKQTSSVQLTFHC